jgi:hypothetical protein
MLIQQKMTRTFKVSNFLTGPPMEHKVSAIVDIPRVWDI